MAASEIKVCVEIKFKWWFMPALYVARILPSARIADFAAKHGFTAKAV